MKDFVKFALVAALSVGVSASHHHHHHLHAKKDATKVQKREPDAATKFVIDALETVYQLGDEVIDSKQAKAGLKGGDYVVVGESVPTYSPPPPPPKPKTTSKDLGAQFIESKTSSTTLPPPPPTSTSTSTTAIHTSKPKPKPTVKPVAQANAASSSSGGQGLNAKFPSGKVKCSDFPDQYGAVPLNWLGLNGWSGLQFVPGFSLLSSLSISKIVTGVSGQSCAPGCMCSYACPPGYQKTQWPKAQGSTKQSIGGMYCNSDGYLELTRDGYDTLCELGEGGVYIQNDLDDIVTTCRTEYPGTENMVIPTVAQPGAKIALTNPSQTKYYQWGGHPTSAQYYINPKGLGPGDACVWLNPKYPKTTGNWAALNAGVGVAADGTTFISIFLNLPTSHAKPDFNVEITGDVNSKCSYVNGVWTGGETGCTTGMSPGGTATIRYF